MQSLKDRIEQLGKTLGKQNIPESYTDYKTVRLEHEALANRDVRQLQKEGKRSRIQTLHGRSDLNPKWTFEIGRASCRERV